MNFDQFMEQNVAINRNKTDLLSTFTMEVYSACEPTSDWCRNDKELIATPSTISYNDMNGTAITYQPLRK